jgi:Peptidase family M48
VEANAYSVPGFIYVDGVLILSAQNEAQLVAVLSHETTHLVGRLITTLVTQQRSWNGPRRLPEDRGPISSDVRRRSSSFCELSAQPGVGGRLLGRQCEYASG